MDSAKYALALLDRGDLSTASTTLARVNEDAKRLQRDAERHSKRLEGLEPWIQKRQEEHQREIGRVESQQQTLDKQERDLRVEISGVRANISHYEELICKTKREINEAEGKKDAAIGGAVAVGIAGVVLAPLTFGTSLIPAAAGTTALAVTASNLADQIKEYSQEKSRLQSKISNLESTANSIDRKKAECQDEIRVLKDKQSNMYEQLREMKKAIAVLMSSVHFWQELAAATEHFDRSGHYLKRLVDRALKSCDLNLMQRQGSQTKVLSFKDAWADVDDKLSSGTIVSFSFQCSRCHMYRSGLPWPVNTSTVICNDCHHHIYK